ncbi:hypothetical protein CVD28_02980 [Bacillus sp. M6-12]|uniref:hypothetical protein n=1 Tax=Bacillus sp. M6-12 TaxID=2054166 RepID=UPI000C78E5BD|nr:hypothetical protein [Bacillus sp. M6-12]PLS19395.1 hypothetical protein CVD28_02980 [Bacillus sp. M6-12]
MSKIIKSQDIKDSPVAKQLEFYRNYFAGLHCELDGCGAELHSDWVIYKGERYCSDCFEWKWNDEKEKAEIEIEKMRKKIKELESEYDLQSE